MDLAQLELKHVALAYDEKPGLYKWIAKYINEGLRRRQLCVFATVYYRDEGFIDEFSKLVDNYEENIEKANLLIVDLSPLYISALLGDIQPFEDAKEKFLAKAAERADKHVRFVGDGTGFMFDNMHFDSCNIVEKWWQQKPFHGSYMCLYSKETLDTFPHSAQDVFATHDIVHDIGGEQQ